jgi:hypothetical protein
MKTDPSISDFFLKAINTTPGKARLSIPSIVATGLLF